MIGRAVEGEIVEQDWIDRIAEPLQQGIQAALKRAPAIAKVLHGKFLGHPLHPALVPVPIGAWTCTLVLDIAGLGGGRRLHKGADASAKLGLAGALVATFAGLADWSTTRGAARRIGFVHGALNMAIAGLYGASIASRAVGLRGIGIALSTTGFGIAGASAWLGGELIYRYGVGVGVDACEQKTESQVPVPEAPIASAYGG
ncbi:hypothetical protein SOCE26_083730 [Sorangium cellulosum]|uniref:DUF2231 domain-containing protein n=1 Tax=Sorangium cellulosum TaxID=56 RepID=A0A2L0F5K4_SORCE|nr:DUF2231 domain-containing protein [Sorangium cellulosum]AUX46864.1 hypothetical protein SOCE26_083730 [Sorangium cellulosum]